MPETSRDLPVPDFAKVFDEAPAPFLLLTPDLVIVHANRARLEATATTLEDTVGRHLFDVFPRNPADPAADGVANLGASLAEARDTRRPVTMPIQRYDIPMPDGSWTERFWSPRNVPIVDDDGEVVLLLHRADDVTEYIQDRDEARRAAARGQVRVEQVESDLFARTRELEQYNAALQLSSERERRAARSLAGLARTVSALATAETTEGLLHLLFEQGRSALGASAASVVLHTPDGQGLTLTEDRGSRLLSADVPPDSPLPMARAAVHGEQVLIEDTETDRPQHPDAVRLLQAWAPARGPPCHCGRADDCWAPGRSAGPTPGSSTTTTSGCWRPTRPSALRRSSGWPGWRPSAGGRRRPAVWRRPSSGRCSPLPRSRPACASRCATDPRRRRRRWAATGTTPSSPPAAPPPWSSATSPATTGPRRP
nr:PAS domain-containing protein [Modestobacter caceresii]